MSINQKSGSSPGRGNSIWEVLKFENDWTLGERGEWRKMEGIQIVGVAGQSSIWDFFK